MKSEPNVFSIDSLKDSPKGTDHWDGIRNYQARNFMRDDMQIGDLVLFYHSNCKIPAVVGMAEISSAPYPDHTALEVGGKYFDPKSSPEKNRWVMVDVTFKKKFKSVVSLQEIKGMEPLQKMRLIQKGNRLSIMPVEKDEFEIIRKLGA